MVGRRSCREVPLCHFGRSTNYLDNILGFINLLLKNVIFITMPKKYGAFFTGFPLFLVDVH